jgi:tetratricopeptide (TPR) repeat protein
MAPAVDPLKDIIFIKIPEKLIPALSNDIDPDILLPIEKMNAKSAAAQITLESIIAGMLRILIYDPNHENAAYYSGIVKKLRPNIKEEFTQAGMLKAKLKDFEIAIEIFRALVALFPDCPICALNCALAYHDAAHQNTAQPELCDHYTEEAFKAYRAAIALHEVLPELHLNYAYFLLEQENYEKALTHFEIYLREEEDTNKKADIEKIVATLTGYTTQDKLFKEAFDYISLGKEKAGIEKVTELLKKNPDFWNAWFLLGWGLRKLGRYAEAKEAFLKALSLGPKKPDLLNELAIVHMELGELSESYGRLIEANKIEPENTKILSNLGIVCIKMDRSEEARDYFRAILSFSPDDEMAKNFLVSLEKK